MERIIDVTVARRPLVTLLDEVSTVTAQQQALLEEMEGLSVIPITSNPVNILRSMREEKKLKAQLKYGE